MSGFGPLSELIVQQLAEERSRKQSLEQRGLAVITSSGTIVSLIFGFTAISTGAKGFTLEPLSRWLLIGTAVAFAAAAVLGIFIQKPLLYSEPGVDWLRKTSSEEVWDNVTEGTAARRSAEARINSIESFRDKNKNKVRLLTGAISLEAAGITALVAAAVTIFE